MNVEKLKEFRRRKALTQRDLANQAGISYVTINQIEQGKHVARASTIRKLAEALGVKPEELTG